jgi:hypothetical protein
MIHNCSIDFLAMNQIRLFNPLFIELLSISLNKTKREFNLNYWNIN